MKTFALSLHIVSFSVWVGGLIVLAALVPALRRAVADADVGRTVVTAAAQRFNVVAWSGLGLALFTGIWMLLETTDAAPAYGRLLGEKLSVVVLAAAAAAAHSFWIGPSVRRAAQTSGDADASPRVRRLRALNGALAGVALAASVAAVFLGVRLSGG
jgi:putative copper export protein